MRREDLPFTRLKEVPIDIQRDGLTWAWVSEWIRIYARWGFNVEPKYDGEDELLVRTRDGQVYLINRYGTVYTDKDLPWLSQVRAGFPFILRGELHLPGGRSFDIKPTLRADPMKLKLVLHDCINWNGVDLRNTSFERRRRHIGEFQLENIFPIESRPAAPEEVEQLYHEAVERGYEGIIIKPLTATYTDEAFLKIKKEVTLDVILLHAKDTEQFRETGIPWSFTMHTHIQGKLTYIGDVSSGLKPEERMELKQLITPEATRIGGEKYYRLSRPIVAEVSCQEILQTEGQTRLRHPKILRLRHDKPPEQCHLSG